VDAGSLTRAAAALGLSQPAMSQRMAVLERQTGTRLLERGPRGIDPTARGLDLYRHAQELVRQFDRLSDSFAGGGQGLSGKVSVGLPSTVAGVLAPELYARTAQHHPGIHLELFESMSGYIDELLGRGRLDLAVLFGVGAPGPDETLLYEEDLYLVTAAATDPSEDPVRLSELAGRPIVTPGARSNLRALIDRAFAAHGLVPHVTADVESLPAMIRIAQTGRASTILPRSVVADFAGPALALRPIVEPVLRRTASVHVATRFYEPQAAVLATRDAIVEAVRALTARGEWPGMRLAA
jgi:LysR family nitrogen assimilation transcriptional regulator